MADGKTITHDFIAEPDALAPIKKEFSDFAILISTVEAGLKKATGELKTFVKGSKIENLADLKKLDEALRRINELEVANAKVKKAKIELTNQQIAQAQVDRANQKQEIDRLKATIILQDKTVGTLKKLEAANTLLRIAVSKLKETDATYGTQLVALNKQIDANNLKMAQSADAFKRQRMNVGNYTESIKDAFTGTGLLGDAINKHLSTITLWAEKIEAAVAAMLSQKVATEATATATKAATITEEANVVALEAQTAATIEADAASKGLGASMKAIFTNPYVIAIASVAGLSKVVYDNVTATDKNRDAIHAWWEGAKAYISSLDVAGVNSAVYAASVKILSENLEELEDKQINLIVSNQSLRTLAAKAREDAAQENVNTKEKIDLLETYITANNKATQAEINHAQEVANAFVVFKTTAEAAGKDLDDDTRTLIEQSIARVQELKEQQASETVRAQKQQTALRNKYYKETGKLLQDAQRQELEAIDTFDENKSEHVKKQYDKDLKLSREKNTQELENLIAHQKELGEVGPDGKDRSAEFKRGRKAVLDAQKQFEKDLLRKKEEELKKIREEEEKKRLEEEKKRLEAIAKQADKDLKRRISEDKENESNELLAIEEKYAKQKDKSVKAEEEKQKAIFAVKLKYLELEKLEEWANPEEQSRIQKQINELKAAYLKTGIDLEKKSDDQRKKLAEERKKDLRKVEDEINAGIIDGLKKRADIQEQADQKEIDRRQKNIDIQAQLAAAGKDNSLAEEQAAADKAEERKIQNQKKALRQQEMITIVKTFSDTLQDALDKNVSFPKALGEALAASGLVSTTFSHLVDGSYIEGTENVAQDLAGNKVHNGKDGYVIAVDGDERILNPSQNKKLGGMSNDELVNNALFARVYKPYFNSTNKTASASSEERHDRILAQRLESKLDSLQKAIESKPVHRTILGDKMGDYKEEILERGMRTVRHHSNSRSSMRKHG